MAKLMKKSTRIWLAATIRQWILDIDRTERLPENVVALIFAITLDVGDDNYGISLEGATTFEPEDHDWNLDYCNYGSPPEYAFSPVLCYCRLRFRETYHWKIRVAMRYELKAVATDTIRELLEERPDLPLFQVKHIAIGTIDCDDITTVFA